MEIQEINIADYIEQDKLNQLSETTDFNGELDATINDILNNTIKDKSDILLYLPDGYITLTIDKLLKDKKVNSLIIDGSGMYTTKLRMKFTTDFPLRKIKIMNLQLTDISIEDSPLLKNIKLLDVEILKASIKNVNLNIVNSEMNENVELNIDDCMSTFNNVVISGNSRKINIKNSESVTVMNVSAEDSVEMNIIDSTINDMLSTNIKYITSGNSSILSIKNARLYSYKDYNSADKISLMSIRYNAILHIPVGAEITDINLNTTESTAGANLIPHRQDSYEWYIEAEKLVEMDTYIAMKYTCHRISDTNGITEVIIKTINK